MAAEICTLCCDSAECLLHVYLWSLKYQKITRICHGSEAGGVTCGLAGRVSYAWVTAESDPIPVPAQGDAAMHSQNFSELELHKQDELKLSFHKNLRASSLQLVKHLRKTQSLQNKLLSSRQQVEQLLKLKLNEDGRS